MKCEHIPKLMVTNGELWHAHHECRGCGEWLPLGPAKITPNVEIEIRAAELVAGDGPEWRVGEWAGSAMYLASAFGVLTRMEEAGYLAAAILDEVP